ncbi:TonB-dependent receptor [Hymenobacter sp. BT770]|uniref:TonB-dependent receptor n=1 Tax=Hymenobacter sp. BT770 TaxID=2886942 RepID=UPI001D122FC7|nr:TonB-dependent receptor [Hymenobacter sp. BT770]MCC3154098.1 TonB-dependent receptor [Hymenobacter sp. BT770]MDO3416242.1 TonB-dependent receptor [Hymenobacter sp. BT770]
MKYAYSSVFLLVFMLLGFTGYGQQAEKAVSGTFAHMRFEQFVSQLEAQTNYRFYFDSKAVDSLFVTLQVQNQPVRAVLEQALQNTAFHFAIDDENRVFVSSAGIINPALPGDFFQPKAATATVVQAEEPVAAGPTGRSRLVSASEYKVYEVGAGGEAGSKATLAGHIRDQKTGEPVIGASIYSESPNIGASTDQFGYYSLTLPVGRYDLKVRGVGIKNTKRQVVLRGNGKLEIEVEEDVVQLKEVVVEAEKDKNVSGMQMGLEKLDIKTMRQVPTAFGETDILRVVMTLPGVKTVGEGSTGLNVRGGATDQNLILFNDATIYNPSHLFGFFSAFNPDILQGVELYKSAIPAKYGGRLSSVLDITTREGNKKKLAGSGGIGPLTSRLTLEGPLLKDRSSFIISGRASYSDWLLHQLSDKNFKQSAASFYDVTAHVSHEINEKNSVYATGYYSTDRFRLASDTTYHYTNQNASLKWRHNFNNQLYGVLTGTISHYDYDITSDSNEKTASQLKYAITQSNLRADFSYFPNSRHTIDFGGSSQLYNIAPGSFLPRGDASLVKPDVLAPEKALESALYASDRFDITPRFSLSVGLRYSLFQALGPRDVYQYTPGESRTEASLTDTVRYAAGKVLATYHGPEYRVSMRYSLNDRSSVKASYTRTRQYIHQLTNTASVSPADIWKLSDANIRPQVGDQVSVGYYRNFKNNTIEASVETYYKSLRDFVDYKSGATLVLNHHIETDIINAQGQAYGTEFFVKKLTGKLNGWVSYTYSRSLVQVNAGTPADMINGGRYYPSNFDKPHDFTLVGNYRFSHRFSTSLNLNYSTGRPITLPLAKYYVGNSLRVFYSDRNAYRVPDYYRMDLALNIEGGHKVKKLAHSSWTVGVYNLTGRRNPYSIYFKSVNGQIKGYQLSIFGEPIPTVTYNFKF